MLIITLEFRFHSIVKEGDVSILFGFRDVYRPHTLLTDPFGEDVGYALRWISNSEGEFGVMPRHGGCTPSDACLKTESTRIPSGFWRHRLIKFSEDGGDLPDPVRPAFEKEKGSTI